MQASDARFLMQSNKGYYEALKTHFEQSASPFINLIEIVKFCYYYLFTLKYGVGSC